MKTLSKFRMHFIALMALLVVSAGAAMGFAPVEVVPDLALGIEWLEGVTGHLDGAFAPGAGGLLTVAGAGALLGEVATADEEDTKRIMSKADLQELLRSMQQESEEPLTDEEIKRAIAEFRKDKPENGGERAQPKDQINPQRDGRSSSSDADVGEPRAPHWVKRTVRYFNALALRHTDSNESHRQVAELRREVAEMPARQIHDEAKEARGIIDDSGLGRQAKHTLRSVLGVEEYRLHTTSTTDTPQAGHLLPKPFLAEVFVVIEQYSVVRGLFRQVPMSSKEVDLKNVLGKVVAYWVDEGENIPASDLVIGPGKLTVGKLAGITSWTRELEEDMAISLLPLVQEQFAESLAEKEDAAGLIGDGTAQFGGNTGLLRLGGAQVITLEAGQTTADALAEAHVRAAKNQLSEVRQRNARWLMHRTVFEHIKQFENSAGYRIFQEMITGTGDATLLGFPVTTAEVMPSLTGVGAGEPFAVLGDPRRTLMGQRRGLTLDVSQEAILQDENGDIAFNAFQADGALLRITERVGYKTPQANEDRYVVLKTASA